MLPPGLRLEPLCWPPGTSHLSPGATVKLHPCSEVPLPPRHTPLPKSPASTLPPPHVYLWKSDQRPRTHVLPPTHHGPTGGHPGDSPGRSTFHSGLFWSMRTDSPRPWPAHPGLAWRAQSGSLGPGGGWRGAEQQGLEEQSGALPALQLGSRRRLLRRQWRGAGGRPAGRGTTTRAAGPPPALPASSPPWRTPPRAAQGVLEGGGRRALRWPLPASPARASGPRSLLLSWGAERPPGPAGAPHPPKPPFRIHRVTGQSVPSTRSAPSPRRGLVHAPGRRNRPPGRLPRGQEHQGRTSGRHGPRAARLRHRERVQARCPRSGT